MPRATLRIALSNRVLEPTQPEPKHLSLGNQITHLPFCLGAVSGPSSLAATLTRMLLTAADWLWIQAGVYAYNVAPRFKRRLRCCGGGCVGKSGTPNRLTTLRSDRCRPRPLTRNIVPRTSSLKQVVVLGIQAASTRVGHTLDSKWKPQVRPAITLLLAFKFFQAYHGSVPLQSTGDKVSPEVQALPICSGWAGDLRCDEGRDVVTPTLYEHPARSRRSARTASFSLFQNGGIPRSFVSSWNTSHFSPSTPIQRSHRVTLAPRKDCGVWEIAAERHCRDQASAGVTVGTSNGRQGARSCPQSVVWGRGGGGERGRGGEGGKGDLSTKTWGFGFFKIQFFFF